MKNFWKNKRVLVTGGAGFLGSYITEELLKLDSVVSITTKSGNLEKIIGIKKDVKVFNGDLKDLRFALKAAKSSDIILNLASKVAGIHFNLKHPALMFSENVNIANNVIEAARICGTKRFLMVSSACVYPRNCTIPTPESEGFLSDPEPTNLGYGWAKRVSELTAKFYQMEYGMKIAIVRPYNSYGPKDDFNAQTSHVIPALIKRVFDEQNTLLVWGSGKQTRSFLFAQDCAKGMLKATEKYACADPVNLGSNEEITIAKLSKLIVKISGKKLRIKFDKTKPDGQPRRNCDTSKAIQKLGFVAETNIEEGLQKTIEWWKNH